MLRSGTPERLDDLSQSKPSIGMYPSYPLPGIPQLKQTCIDNSESEENRSFYFMFASILYSRMLAVSCIKRSLDRLKTYLL